MPQNEKITRRQLGALMFVGLLSPVMRVLPALSVARAGKAAWLSPIAAAPGLLLLALLAGSLLKRRGPGEGLGEIIRRALGEGVGKGLILLYCLWLSLYSGFVLRAGAERLLSTMFSNGHAAIYVLGILAVALLMARGRLRALARTAELLFLILLVTLLLALAAALPQVRAENLLPVRAADLEGVLLGAVPVLNALSPWVYLLFLSGGLSQEQEGRLAYGLRWQGLSLGLVFLLMLTTVGAFGEAFLLRLQAPFFVLIRDIRILNVVERVEALVVAVWLITDLIFVAGLLSAASEGLRGALGKRQRSGAAIFCAVLALGAAFLWGGSAFQTKKFSETVIPAINLAFTVGGSLLIFITQKIRKK